MPQENPLPKLQKDIMLKALHHHGKPSLPLEPSLFQGHMPMKAAALCVLTPSQTSHMKQETQIVQNGTWHALQF